MSNVVFLPNIRGALRVIDPFFSPSQHPSQAPSQNPKPSTSTAKTSSYRNDDPLHRLLEFEEYLSQLYHQQFLVAPPEPKELAPIIEDGSEYPSVDTPIYGSLIFVV